MGPLHKKGKWIFLNETGIKTKINGGKKYEKGAKVGNMQRSIELSVEGTREQRPPPLLTEHILSPEGHYQFLSFSFNFWTLSSRPHIMHHNSPCHWNMY